MDNQPKDNKQTGEAKSLFWSEPSTEDKRNNLDVFLQINKTVMM